MKKLNCFFLVLLLVLIPTLQSCDESDGYSIGPVSYTHLRAVVANTSHWGCTRCDLEVRISTWSPPVSYTHLDVYKRQV